VALSLRLRPHEHEETRVTNAEHTHKTPTWYREAIFYSVDVARFKDSDANGFGDFNGLTGSLDYLSWLGIDTIWLQPFYRSPRRDNGYDVIDHYEIDPRLGGTGDFVAFLREAEDRNIRIIIDLVVNHTSNEHKWFQSSRKGPSSPHWEWYVWTDDLAKVPDYPVIFPPGQTTTWTWDESANAWYLHHFHEFEPDLNTDCPAVREETRNMVEYWIRLGVRGFRFDGAPYLGQKKQSDDHAPHACLHAIHTWADALNEETIIIPEADLPPQELAPYAGNGDAQMLFNFIGCEHLFLAMATERAEPVERAIGLMPPGTADFEWLNFLRHHDELTLERLTEDERQQVLDAFAPDPDMQIYERGTRRRLAPMLNGDRRRLELAFSMMFALPGAPVVLAGDEIGMGENLDLPERDAARLPIQWSADEPNGGFSGADPNDLVTPVLADGPFGVNRVNISSQRKDPNSFLHWMRKLIAVRKRANPCMSATAPQVHIPAPSVLVLVYPGEEGRALVTVHNVGNAPASFVLENTVTTVEPLLTDDSTISGMDRSLEIAPYGYIWWEQEGIPHLSSTRELAALAGVDGEDA
jgi:maltose alpha-D-glucosyltransferase / alpha-amylase